MTLQKSYVSEHLLIMLVGGSIEHAYTLADNDSFRIRSAGQCQCLCLNMHISEVHDMLSISGDISIFNLSICFT